MSTWPMRIRGLSRGCWEIHLLPEVTNPNQTLAPSACRRDVPAALEPRESWEEQAWVLVVRRRVPELTTPGAALPLDLSLFQGAVDFLVLVIPVGFSLTFMFAIHFSCYVQVPPSPVLQQVHGDSPSFPTNSLSVLTSQK